MMRAHTQTPHAATQHRRLALCLALLAALCGAATEARAASTCSIGFPVGTPLVSVNGLKDGAEWNDASRLLSSDSCFGQLGDYDTVAKDVTVYTKRYAGFLAFYFEVGDFSSAPLPGQDCGGKLCGGERVVIQFDPNLSRGAQVLSNTVTPKAGDYQIVIIHKWTNTGGGVLQIESAKVYSAGDDGSCNPTWVEINPGANAPQVGIHQLAAPTGYGVEVAVPLALLGTPTTNVGTALAVLNDFGDNAAGPPFAAGVSFPSTLQFTGAENPIYFCRGNWVVPNEWGTGYFGDAAGDVKISRSPEWWYSNQIIATNCTSGGPAYRWHQTTPCKTVLNAYVQNSTASVQTRHLLYLWAKHGSGDPAVYNFVGLKKVTNIAASNMNAGPFDSPVFSPPADPAHPCVRVYILPPNLLPAYDENFFNTHPTLTKAEVDAMMAAYASAFGFGTQHWAQKNINQVDANPVCPTCAADLRDALRPQGAADTASLTETGTEASAEAWRGALFNGQAAEPTRGAVLSGARPVLPLVFVRPAPEPDPQVSTPDRPPVVPKPGRNVIMPREDLERFARGNVIVQIRTFGYEKARGAGTPVYTFVENMGGVVELVPVEMLRNGAEVPFQFNVSNGDRERTVYHVVDVLIPAGAAGAEVGVETARRVFAPNEQRVVRGFVRLPGKASSTPSDDEFRRWGLSLHAGASIPHGNFNNVYNPGPNVGVDLEYRFNRRFSLEAIYTFNHFRGETLNFLGQPFTLDGTNIHNLSLNGKVYGGTSPVRPFVNFGGGVYVFDSATARGGVNVGGGLQFDLTPTVALDSMYNFHNVFGSGSSLRYSTVQGGVRFRF